MDYKAELTATTAVSNIQGQRISIRVRNALISAFSEQSVTAKTIPRHARTLQRQRWVSRPRESRFPAALPAVAVPEPGRPAGRVPADPLAGPVATLEPAVLGDRIRRPAAWCEMAACISRYDDPTALGEADIRARALGAGWRHDAVGRLVCPYCQQHNPALCTAYPLVPQDHRPGSRTRHGAGHARAGRISAVWSTLAAWYRNRGGDQDRRPRWLHLPAALAGGGDRGRRPPSRPVTRMPGRHSAGPAGLIWPEGHRAAVTSPVDRGGTDHGRQRGQQREQDHAH
jgi:hypothetical protein